MTLVVHSVAGLAPESGGPSRTVTYLTDNLSREENISITLLTQRRSGTNVVEAGNGSKVDRRVADSSSSLALTAGLPFKRMLHVVICTHKPALLHDHGIWHLTNHYAARAACRFGIPLLIHTRGMLEPWSIKHRVWKKRLAMQLYQRRDLESATLFFATAPQEVESLRRLGLKQPVAVIPNGVELPALANKVTRDQEVHSPGAVRNAVFMSRIHPIKGLLNLVEAWGRVQPRDWRLLVAGPDEGGHQAEVTRRVQTLGLEASVEFVGEVHGGNKRALFESADLFILPSFSENFGVVIAEALAHEVPVITTRGTPWEGLVSHGCGWWIEPTADALTATLQEAMSMAPEELQEMGEKGREYAYEFDWTHVAQQTAEVYRWVLGEGPLPDCVMHN